MPAKPAKPKKRSAIRGVVKTKKQPVSREELRRHRYARVPWGRRAEIVERYIEMVFNKLAREGKLSAAHHLGHVKRVAYYAMKYVELLGASPALQLQAKIAGLTHDRIRYPTEKIPHEEASAKFMESLFAKRYGEEPTKRITTAIAKHGSLPPLSEVGKNIIRDAVVFADKFFEANGAYIAFRRAMFMGEREDRREEARRKGYDLNTKEGRQKAAIDFTLDETNKRIAKFSDLSKIPEFLHPFIKYQVQWQIKLRDALERREPSIVNLVTYCFEEGLKPAEERRPLDEVIKSYKPIGKLDAEFKREALRYLRGELWEEFVKRIKVPK